MPNDFDSDANIVDAIAANAMGVDPEQAAAAPDAGTGADQTPDNATTSPDQPAGEAAENLDPVTEDELANDDPITFKVNINGQDREITDAQIRGTYERYTALNGKHSDMKEWIALGEAMQNAARQGGQEVDFPTLAQETHKALVAANTKNPEMGKQAENPGDGQQPPQDIRVALEQWEKDNAVDLPPGYRESGLRMRNVENAIAELTGLVQTIAQGQAGVTGAAENIAAEAKAEAVNATKSRIATNIDRAQQNHGVQDGEEGAFLAFMQVRGYTPEDFVNADLADQVMGDYVNTKNSGEFERLQALAAKRQAFTGTVDGAPAGNAVETPKPSEDEAVFGDLVNSGLRRIDANFQG